jgi:hypothetical protein
MALWTENVDLAAGRAFAGNGTVTALASYVLLFAEHQVR